MSPILDLQRRLAEVGRIRLGEQVTTRSGKKAPAKLTKFRFTSPSVELIDQAATLYGGTPNDWTAPSGPQREVVTEATSIPVLIPPGDMAFSQWYETWSGGGCQKRCDGRFDIQRDRACDCDPDARECKPTTRVSMVLPEMAGVGLWRVETHGFYAATELGATVELLQSLAPGRLVPGRLRLDARTVKRTVDGKPQTRNYVVPVLDIEGTMAQIGQTDVPVAIEASRPSLTPVPAAAIPETTGLSVAEQLAVTKETPRRKNAAAVLPPTGLEPGPPALSLASPEQVSRIDVLLPQVPDHAMPALKAWKAEQGISMKAGEFTAEHADMVIAKLEQLAAHSLPVEEPTTPTASAHGAGDGDDKGTDDGTLTSVGESLTVPEVSGGGESVPPPTAAPDVRTGGEDWDGPSAAAGMVAPPTPSGVSPVPGGGDGVPTSEAPMTPSGPDTPTAAVLLAATGKTAGSAVVALKRAAAEVNPDGPFMAEEIEADPEFAARVLAHLGGMPTEGAPVATYSKKQNGWIHAVWANHGGDNARKAYLSQLTSGRTDSSGELTAAEKKAYLAKTEEMA